MKHVTFRMVAYTDAAGKYDANAPLFGNEDNFYVDDDLSDNQTRHFKADETIMLSDSGMIMVVADGMGGQNAGEVAAAMVVNTVHEFFSPGKMEPTLAATHESRKKYLETVIAEANRRIVSDAEVTPEHGGMASTVIMAWMVGDELTVTWCGDSRAYRFNPHTGIELLSEDHSYVQELVKHKVLTYEDTFDHPQGNIVTRSLGDSGERAQPETKLFNVKENDIILLCSDGLSGVLRDKPTFDPDGKLYPGDTIEDVIRNNSATMTQCKDALVFAAKNADWYDNVTILLCQVVSVSGNTRPLPVPASEPEKHGISPKTSALIAIITFGIGGLAGFMAKCQQTLVPETCVVLDSDSIAPLGCIVLCDTIHDTVEIHDTIEKVIEKIKYVPKAESASVDPKQELTPVPLLK